MTRDDVIRAAGEAGFYFHDAGFAPTLHTVPLEYSEKCFERFAALIEAAATEKANERANTSWALMCEKMVKAEREACAKVCEGRIGGATKEDTWWSGFRSAMSQCADVIRARGKK